MKPEILVLLVLISFCLFSPIQAYGAEEATMAPAKRLLLNLSTNLLSVATDNKTSFVANVENVGDQPIEYVKISIEGIQSSWVEAIPASTDIPANGLQSYLVTINVPKQAETRIYELIVKAMDEVESNSEVLDLVVGKNLKEITDLLLKEFEDTKNLAERSLLVEDCIDVTVIKVIHEDAGYAYQRGLEDYGKENYTKAINWFEYAIPVERNVVSRVDKNLEMELKASKATKIIIPPFYEPEEQFIQAQAYLEEKNYEDICDPIVKIRKYVTFGKIFWPIIAIIIIILVVIFVIFYKRKKIEERVGIMERVRERLGEPEETV